MGISPYPLKHRFHLWLRDVPSLFFLSLMLVCPLFLFFQTQQICGICLVDHKLPHLLLRFVVVGVCRFFLRQQPCKFFVQAFDFGKLFKTEIVKGFLCRLMNQNIALMLCKIRC